MRFLLEETVLIKKSCPFCQGTGVTMVLTSKFLGLIKKEIPSNCTNCAGVGMTYEMPTCKFCEGQGLVGNESEVCWGCNGTGKVGAFAAIPREKLIPGTIFQRRCSDCGSNSMEIEGEIEMRKLTKSWEKEEELRSIEMREYVKVKCPECNASYSIPLDKNLNKELPLDEIRRLEEIGINLDFMYQK